MPVKLLKNHRSKKAKKKKNVRHMFLFLQFSAWYIWSNGYQAIKCNGFFFLQLKPLMLTLIIPVPLYLTCPGQFNLIPHSATSLFICPQNMHYRCPLPRLLFKLTIFPYLSCLCHFPKPITPQPALPHVPHSLIQISLSKLYFDNINKLWWYYEII